jgi:hypothetical protein
LDVEEGWMWRKAEESTKEARAEIKRAESSGLLQDHSPERREGIRGREG